MKNNKGMTMIEVLVAITIMTIGLLAIAAVLPQAYRASIDSRKLSMATGFSQQMMELLKSEPISSPLLTSGVHPAGAPTTPLTVSADPGYTQWWSVQTNIVTGMAINRVTLWTKWQNSRGLDSISVITYISNI